MHQSHSHFCPSDTGIEGFLEEFQSFPLIPSLYLPVGFPLCLVTWLPLLETAPVSCPAPWSKQAPDTVFEGVFMWPSEESHVAPSFCVPKWWDEIQLQFTSSAAPNWFNLSCVIVPALGFAFQGRR